MAHATVKIDTEAIKRAVQQYMDEIRAAERERVLVSHSTVLRMIRAKKLRAEKVGGGATSAWMVREADLPAKEATS